MERRWGYSSVALACLTLVTACTGAVVNKGGNRDKTTPSPNQPSESFTLETTAVAYAWGEPIKIEVTTLSTSAFARFLATFAAEANAAFIFSIESGGGTISDDGWYFPASAGNAQIRATHRTTGETLQLEISVASPLVAASSAERWKWEELAAELFERDRIGELSTADRRAAREILGRIAELPVPYETITRLALLSEPTAIDRRLIQRATMIALGLGGYLGEISFGTPSNPAPDLGARYQTLFTTNGGLNSDRAQMLALLLHRIAVDETSYDLGLSPAAARSLLMTLATGYKRYLVGRYDFSEMDLSSLTDTETRSLVWKNANLRDTNLTGVDFFGVDLLGADLRGSNAVHTQVRAARNFSYPLYLPPGTLSGDQTGVDLSGLDLSNQGLTWSQISQARSLRYTKLTGIDLSGVTTVSPGFLVRADLSNTGIPWSAVSSLNDFTGMRLRGMDFTGANFAGKTFNDVDFRDTNVTVAQLAAAVGIRNTDLRGLTLNTGSLSGKDLSGADLRGAVIGWAQLAGATLGTPSAKLAGVDLSGANFTGQNLNYIDLRGTGVTWAQLSLATSLLYADLRGLNLVGADFTGKDIRRARFSGTGIGASEIATIAESTPMWDVRGLDLRNVDLSGKSFASAFVYPDEINISQLTASNDLAGIDLRGFDLSGTDLTAVNLSGAKLDHERAPWSSIKSANIAEAILEGYSIPAGELATAVLDPVYPMLQGQNSSLVGADFDPTELAALSTWGYSNTSLDLSAIDLTGVDTSTWPSLSMAKFRGSVLRNAIINSSDSTLFLGADVTGATFTGNVAGFEFIDMKFDLNQVRTLGNVAYAQFVNLDLRNQTVGGYIPFGSSFSYLDFRGSTLSGISLEGTTIFRPRITAAQLSQISFLGSAMSEVNLPGETISLNFSALTISDCDLSNATLLLSGSMLDLLGNVNGATLDLQGGSINLAFYAVGAPVGAFHDLTVRDGSLGALSGTGADLTGATFDGLNISNLNLEDANLTGASFAGATLVSASFDGATMPISNAGTFLATLAGYSGLIWFDGTTYP